MRMTKLFFIYLLIFINVAQAQTYLIPRSPILDTLFQLKADVSEISTVEAYNILPIYINKDLRPQFLIKNKKGLFVLVEGTGMVFKAMQVNNSNISFTRIDSTFYSGYNFGAINFSYQDTIYSFGGNGFWTTNGHLRYLGDGNEWDAIELNAIYPTARYVYNYLPKQDKLYYIQFIANNKYANYNKEEFGVVELDLHTKNIKLIGKMNPNLIEGFSRYVHINSPSLKGTIVFNKGQIYLYRFIDNSVYKFKNNLISSKFYLEKNVGVNINFEYDSQIYFSKGNDKSLQNFKLTLEDFEKTKEPLFIPIIKSQTIYFYCIGVFLIFVIFTFSFLYFKRRKINKSENSTSIDTASSQNDFNDFEISVIYKIIAKSEKNEPFTVEELNNALGLGKKTIEIQKKVRTESINRLNHKFKLVFSAENELIERVRSEEDRRYYIYIVNVKNAAAFKSKYK